MIWLRYRIDSWRDLMTVNDMNIMKSATPSSLVGKFFT